MRAKPFAHPSRRCGGYRRSADGRRSGRLAAPAAARCVRSTGVAATAAAPATGGVRRAAASSTRGARRAATARSGPRRRRRAADGGTARAARPRARSSSSRSVRHRLSRPPRAGCAGTCAAPPRTGGGLRLRARRLHRRLRADGRIGRRRPYGGRRPRSDRDAGVDRAHGPASGRRDLSDGRTEGTAAHRRGARRRQRGGALDDHARLPHGHDVDRDGLREVLVAHRDPRRVPVAEEDPVRSDRSPRAISEAPAPRQPMPKV